MDAHTTILITGANRGIGRAIADTYLARANHTIVALVRDPTHQTSKSLSTQPTGTNSTVIIVPYDASSTTSADTAIGTLKAQTPSITHFEIVIANAGFNDYAGPSLSANAETYISHYTVNTLAPLLLFHACLPFLTTFNPRFIALSSGAGSTTLLSTRRINTAGKPRPGSLPYTAAKCALNHAMCKLDLEYPEITIGLFTPGPTKTGFGGDRVDWGLIPGVMDVESVVVGLVKQFDGLKAGEESDSEEKKFVLRDYKGEEMAW